MRDPVGLSPYAYRQMTLRVEVATSIHIGKQTDTGIFRQTDFLLVAGLLGPDTIIIAPLADVPTLPADSIRSPVVISAGFRH